MKWKLLGMSAFFSQILMGSAMGSACNYKLLDMVADNMNSRLSMHQSITPDEIRDSLSFIYDESRIGEEYKQPESFHGLYTKMENEVEGSFSKKFIEDCRSIFEDANSDLRVKSSVHLLLEKFREKHTQLVTLMRRHEQMQERENKEPAGSGDFSDKSEVFKMFFDRPKFVKTH